MQMVKRTEMAKVLRNQIRAGVHPVGGRMPSTRDLVQELGGSRTTVSAALRMLADEGLLEIRDRSTAVVRPIASRAVLGPDEDVFHAAYTENHQWLRDILAGQSTEELERLRTGAARLVIAALYEMAKRCDPG